MYTTVEQHSQPLLLLLPQRHHSNYFPSTFKTTTPSQQLPGEHHNPTKEISSSFQQLSLNIPPPDTKKFNFICLFFNHILNLKDPTIILEKEKDILKFNKLCKIETDEEQQPVEILKNLVFPPDIWIRDEIKVKDIKIKSTMLNEVNEMIETELKDVNDQSTFEEITLNYYAKLLVAYKFYDIPIRVSHPTPYLAHNRVLEEEEEDGNRSPDFDFGFLEKPVYRTSSNQSSGSSKSKDRRSSTGSNLSKKRFLSFLGGSTSTSSPESSTQPPSIPQSNMSNSPPPQLQYPILPPPQTSQQQQQQQQQQQLVQQQQRHSQHSASSSSPKQQHTPLATTSSSPTLPQEGTFNSILSKSKLYGRIKKHRESQASMNSNMSLQSLGSNNRNSVSTNATTTSVGSRRRSNYAVSSTSLGASTSLLSSASTIHDETIEQRVENLKDKYEYYIQILRLFKNSEKILRVLVNSHNINNKLLKFIEFIKKRLLKFIMIDIMSMMLTYCDLQCVNFYNVK